MNTPAPNLDLETRLRNAALRATSPHSIAEEILHQLPSLNAATQALGLQSLGPVPSHRRRALLAAALTALTATAALLAVAFFLLGNNPRLTLADVQSAVENQKWIHIRYDAGPLREEWINLQTGTHATIAPDGHIMWTVENSSSFLHFSKDEGVIQRWTFAPTTQPALKWTPRNAWDEIVAPLEKNAATQLAQSPPPTPPTVTATHDILDGSKVVRFDSYENDAIGNRFLHAQLWADPRTHLPLRIKTLLQLGDRQRYHQDWTTGTYEFPDTGPVDIYALGVPRTVLIKEVTTAAPNVKPILDAINQARADFIKQPYRAAVTKNRDELNVFWRDGERMHQNIYNILSAETEADMVNPPPSASPFPKMQSLETLFAWAKSQHPFAQEMSDSERDYSWNFGKPKSLVQVMPHQKNPLFATDAWIEQMQWPTYGWVPDFELAPADADTPPGCLHLHYGATRQNYRADYYIDPKNDYVCMKKIEWNSYKGQWIKVREYTLSDLQRISGKIVAGHQLFHNFPDPAQGTSDGLRLSTIYYAPATPADYPKDIFNPASLTTGATVVGY